jgi:hypothetical protein
MRQPVAAMRASPPSRWSEEGPVAWRGTSRATTVVRHSGGERTIGVAHRWREPRGCGRSGDMEGICEKKNGRRLSKLGEGVE